MTWNVRLKYARTQREISKSDLAKKVGVSAPTMTDWESGEIKKIDGENLLKLSDALAVSPRWLLWGTQETVVADEETLILARAIMRIKDQAQKEAILTQLKAFGAL